MLKNVRASAMLYQFIVICYNTETKLAVQFVHLLIRCYVIYILSFSQEALSFKFLYQILM